MNGFMIGGIANGLAQGLQLGTQIRSAMDQAQVRNAMADGLEGAKQSRADDIEANSQVGSKANADNTMTVPTFEDTRGNTFADAESQKQAAEKNAPSLDDFYMRDVVPKIKETYLAQGNAQGAEAWDKWTQDKQAQIGMKHWTQALRSAQVGDFNAYADNMIKAYNTPGYYEDGLQAEGYDLIKDKDGNTTGLTLKMKNRDTGETFSQSVHGQDDMYQIGIGLLDPANAFKTTGEQIAARNASQAKVGLENLKSQNQMVVNNAKIVTQAAANSQLQGQKANDKLDQITTSKQLDAINQKQLVELKQTAGLLFKKGASPQEAHRMLTQGMSSKFVDFDGKPTMSPEEIGARATKIVEETYGKGSLGNPMSTGLPGAQPTATPVKGAVRLDMQTGQILPYQ